MALVDCRECSGRIAESAQTCPHCGAPGPNPKKPNIVDDLSDAFGTVVWLVVSLVVLLVVLGFATRP